MGLVVVNHLCLDGVMQGPGRPDEDTRDGFERGGWAAERSDEVMQREVGKRMGGGLVLGRRSYDGAQAAELELIEALTSTTGVIVATYRPA